MIQKPIVFFGQRLVLACDGRCDKAWGINGRPRHRFQPEDIEPDDHVHLPDSALGTAPGPGETVGLSEGGEMKPSAVPLTDGARMNKWCARECERSEKVKPGAPIVLDNMEDPIPNMPHRRTPEQEARFRAIRSGSGIQEPST